MNTRITDLIRRQHSVMPRQNISTVNVMCQPGFRIDKVLIAGVSALKESDRSIPGIQWEVWYAPVPPTPAAVVAVTYVAK